jgi:hypothetical protein
VECFAIREVALEGLLRRVGDALPVELEVARVDAAGPVAEQTADLSREHRTELDVRQRSEPAERDDPGRGEPLLRPRADPGQEPRGERCEEPRFAARRHDCDPSGLPAVGCDLAHHLRRRDAERARQRRRAADGDLDRLREPPCAGERVQHGPEIEVALVETCALDARNDLLDAGPDGLRILAVEGMPRAHEHRVRATPERLRRAHRRSDAEAPGHVVRRRHDTSAAWISADDEGPRPERRALELLDRGEERIEVEVREDSHDRYKATVRS